MIFEEVREKQMANGGMVDTMAKPLVQKSNESSLSRLHNAVANLADEISMLEDRLGPIMTPQPLEPSPTRPEEPNHVIHSMAGRLEELIKRLNYLRNSVDL